MKRLALVATAALAACSAPPMMTADAGPDTSCGLDCDVQNRLGLIVNRCFEYSGDPDKMPLNPPTLGMQVKPVLTLEGGVKVLPLEFRQNGAARMIDNLGIVNGEVRLMRREFLQTGQSVTYRNSKNEIVGVKWTDPAMAPGETYAGSAEAYVVNSMGVGETTSTNYKVSVFDGTITELKTPLKTYDAGLKMVFSETPDHGSDARRVLVNDVGFVLISTSLQLNGTTPLAVSLQRIRDIGTPDAGTDACSLGAP